MGYATINSRGWYVVIDSSRALTFAKQYQTVRQREAAMDSVAERLLPGTWFGHGETLQDALQEAFERYFQFATSQGKGEQDADPSS